jgi:hypothetical protein
MKALVIPSEGPLVEVELVPNDDGSSLAQLQALVGGYIQALPLPEFIPGSDYATAYINEEGKFDPDCKPNMRATDFFVPGIGLMHGDYIAGAVVLCGFDPEVGENRDVPQAVIDRARLIESEAG